MLPIIDCLIKKHEEKSLLFLGYYQENKIFFLKYTI